MGFFTVRSPRNDTGDLIGQVNRRLAEAKACGQPVAEPEEDLRVELGSGDTALALKTMAKKWIVNGDEIIYSTRPLFGSIIIRFQRLARRLTWWYTAPIVFQVTEFNQQTLKVLNDLHDRQQYLYRSLEQLTTTVDLLRARIASMSADEFVGINEGVDARVFDGSNQYQADSSLKQLASIKSEMALIESRLDALQVSVTAVSHELGRE